MDLTTPLTYVKGIGPARAAMLEAKGLVTVEDLLGYVPFRYEDRSNLKTDRPARARARWRRSSRTCARPSSPASNGATWACSKRASPTRRAPSWSGKWFHGGYLANVLAEGMKLALFGKVEFDSYSGELTMLHPEFEILSGDDDDGEASLHTGRVVPIYEARRQTHHARAAHADAPHPAGKCGRSPTTCRSTSATRCKCPDRWTAIRDDALSPRPIPTCGCSTLPLDPAAVPPHLRGVLLAGMRRRAEAQQGADAARHRVRDQRPRPRARQGDAALQAHRGAEARDQRDRRRHEGAASDEPPAAGRRRQRQDHRAPPRPR